MKAVIAFSGLLLLILVTAAIWTAVAEQIRKADIMATHSAADSLLTGLQNSDVANTSSNDWHVLSDAEYLEVVMTLKNSGISLDACPSCYTEAGLFGDAWGAR